MTAKRFIAYLLPSLLFVLPVFVLADNCPPNQLCNPLGQGTTLESFLGKVLDLVVQIGFPFIVLFIVFVGFRFIAASGNAEELKKARQLLFWALVGALIVLGAKGLSDAIKATIDQFRS